MASSFLSKLSNARSIVLAHAACNCACGILCAADDFFNASNSSRNAEFRSILFFYSWLNYRGQNDDDDDNNNNNNNNKKKSKTKTVVVALTASPLLFFFSTRGVSFVFFILTIYTTSTFVSHVTFAFCAMCSKKRRLP